ncbi:gamma-glutamyl-gamma-aminobutyrate hydrolase family protein [Nocardioides daeguensis]|uniref:Gamma-glutamyl-gamma-aminobutyrate hydrolase family protein n=1 Tax=Nocardioides daeguensis TaxID=908359 RepID=A0ABP6UWM1_9ACTN|nr:gamma-glutamyl-gamma-aminobutyrate hydrolase family protein [Nocardioides daeguensis]MBV6728746.1 gamma-glutamyl-gamma-aminobutyrate hydrolase family protein [Nocardioides daeguensis]MCR1773644.1 gamma-glutamyl-gamma-aminobutyrate hydrolase family protein [Nocardioides daeguensis]
MSAVVHRAEVLPSGPAPADPVARVGVLVSLNFPDMDEEIAALARRFTRVALATLADLGAAIELLDTSTPLPDPEAIGACDGLLLLGGGDIDAACFGPALSEVPNGYGVDRRADLDALHVLGIAEGADLPVLGICRGSQLINVHRGGTVVADLEDYVLHRGGPGEPLFLDETVLVEEGTRLHAVLDADRVVVRSGHHQAVDRVGRGLVVAARALDGVVEAIEDPARWVLGVQWHPEDDDGSAADRQRLLGAFVAACAARRNHQQIEERTL